MPEDTPGVSSTGVLADTLTPAVDVVIDVEPVVLRFPRLSRRSWFSVCALRFERGTLPERGYRLARFLTYESVDPHTGRIVDRIDRPAGARGVGGMDLAERYAYVHGVSACAFWRDLALLRELGLAEYVLRAAPGRKAVYGLCLAVAAIPAHLPVALQREMSLHTVPEPEPQTATVGGGMHAGAARFRLAGEPLRIALTLYQSQALAMCPRWTPPATVPGEAERAVVPAGSQCETSLLYATALPPFGLQIPVSSKSGSAYGMEYPKRTRQEAAGGLLSRDPILADNAERLLRRCYAVWRNQLGPAKVILRGGGWSATGEWIDGDARNELLHVIAVALRRSSVAELFVLLTTGINEDVADVGRLAAWRCWRLIQARRNAHGYGPTVAAADRLADENGAHAADTRQRKAEAAEENWAITTAGLTAVRAELEAAQASQPAPTTATSSRTDVAGGDVDGGEIPAAPARTPTEAENIERVALERATQVRGHRPLVDRLRDILARVEHHDNQPDEGEDR